MSSSNPIDPLRPGVVDSTAPQGSSHARAAAATAASCASTPLRRLNVVVFGPDPRLGRQARSAAAFALLHAIWAVIHWATTGDIAMMRGLLYVELATNLVGVLGFYPWIRLGGTRRLRDSGLILPQMLWATLSATLGFAFEPPLRPALLQTLCIVQMYGFFHLRPRQLMLTGGVATAMLSCALALGAAGRLPRFEVGAELYPGLLTVSVLIGITLITIDHSVRRSRMQAKKIELDAAVAAVRDLVIRDTLTGLFNRRHMQELLQQERTRALRTGRPFAVALMDIDHFKRINDAHGHATGDEVLKGFAQLATLAMRQSDTVARWGGEEFLVLMPETASESEVLAPLERLQSEIVQSPAQPAFSLHEVTFSAGIAFHRIDEPVEHAVGCADRALYAAKAAGRNRLWVDAETLASAVAS